MVARSVGSTVTSALTGNELHPWSDYMVEYDQAPRQPDIMDLPTARGGILHLAEQMDKIRNGMESGFMQTDSLVARLNQFGAQLDSHLTKRGLANPLRNILAR